MRVNHAGEVAAQALYRGQALTARDPGAEATLRQAAAEEVDHLAW
jgi:ubiquinone biosynthesis monooxygenase Coq7